VPPGRPVGLGQRRHRHVAIAVGTLEFPTAHELGGGAYWTNSSVVR
jgi:hypothetical protein